METISTDKIPKLDENKLKKVNKANEKKETVTKVTEQQNKNKKQVDQEVNFFLIFSQFFIIFHLYFEYLFFIIIFGYNS